MCKTTAILLDNKSNIPLYYYTKVLITKILGQLKQNNKYTKVKEIILTLVERWG